MNQFTQYSSIIVFFLSFHWFIINQFILDHSTHENDSSKISMLRQVELVHSDDSEATTIDDETYEDDFTGEQTN